MSNRSNKLFDLINNVVVLGPPVIIEKNVIEKKEIRLNVLDNSWNNCMICGTFKKLKPLVGNKKIVIVSDFALNDSETHGCYVTYPVKCDTEFDQNTTKNCKVHLLQEIVNIDPKFVICVGPLSWLAITGNYKSRNFETKKIDTGKVIYCKLESLNECYDKVLDKLANSDE